ncbi:tryptophan-rich sensory protein [Arsukibacterium sp. MJ3]|jgi:tryptophan-rich sensory protein|uniref:TspO/MBR family protein n=1 Tax=Arsukibacterium sp. MJ3 TaxID=1632859 RepID=UPI000627126F|nr:TspO/MBR family protein [Arsukibacterium sp. MJ3]KKO49011.1 tryptophan-rich sensory protein [Arsukibacterium sp. MJ3]
MYLTIVLRQVLMLLAILAITYLAAGIGALGSINAANFYRELQLPGWAPPSWLFGPVWTALYTLMAIAAWLVWRSSKFSKPALQLYFCQLMVNTLWSWLFFAWYQGGLAFANIILLLVLIIVTLVSFWRLHKLAALLLVPYLLWVGFAAVLNFSIWQLNPGTL